MKYYIARLKHALEGYHIIGFGKNSGTKIRSYIEDNGYKGDLEVLEFSNTEEDYISNLREYREQGFRVYQILDFKKYYTIAERYVDGVKLPYYVDFGKISILHKKNIDFTLGGSNSISFFDCKNKIEYLKILKVLKSKNLTIHNRK